MTLSLTVVKSKHKAIQEVNALLELLSASPERAQFLDYRKIAWQRVRRIRYFSHQRFRYDYPGPIRDLRHRLTVVPRDRHGDQQLITHELTVDPQHATLRHSFDRYGNRIYDIELLRVDQSVTFEVTGIVERTVLTTREALSVPSLESDSFLDQTSLTLADEHLAKVAQELAAQESAGQQPIGTEQLVERISNWVYDAMRYDAGATDVKTTATEAFSIGRGLCQDYTHLMLALCRQIGLPARYVSGHMLGEGGSHAWVEVLLPLRNNHGWRFVAIDPTNRRWVNFKYITVACGCDYADVAPTSGTFTASYGGHLTFAKKLGVTSVEYLDGERLTTEN